MDTVTNPIEAVQLIPIFSYLNILSDFLFTEQCLQEIDQNKQIPIVNALYEYFEHHKNNKDKKVELIRTLLKGSDLYGEKDDEHFDETFVNAMFNYIISSLVFDKYGNIYGFLAIIFCKAENLQLYEILNLVMNELKNASFENEYGGSSNLNILSVGRICKDIILPLFPRSTDNLHLLSLDYIYAQAGSMFLQPGRIDTNYYKKFENSVLNLTDDDLFDEYLATGHIIEKLILTEEKYFKMIKAFALPALTYHIFNSKYLFVYENMAHIISNSDFWQTAYKQLFQYTGEVSNAIKDVLNNDYTLKMNIELYSFQSSTAMAKTFLEHHCTNYNENQRTLAISFYLQYPKAFQCKIGNSLPNVKEYFKSQITNVTKMYEMYDLLLVQEVFPKSLIEKLETTEVIIKLLIPNNTVEHGDYSESHLPYDFLEFQFPNNLTFDYYILKREDYNVTLINEQLFEEENRLYYAKLLRTATSRTLKRTDENYTAFLQNLVQYKTSRLQTYLEFLNYHEGNKSLESDWWKEFGFSLVPYYPCLSDTSGTNYGNNCTWNEIKFLYENQNESSKLINSNSHSFLSSVGTSIRSMFLKNATYEILDEIVPREGKYRLSISYALYGSDTFEDISQYIGDPAFQLTFASKDEISVLELTILSLRERTNLTFTSVISRLLKITLLKTNFFRSVGTISGNKTRLTYVNSFHNPIDTGYGYKFIFTFDTTSKTAQLRTGYKLKDQLLLSPILHSAKNKKKYIAFNNTNFEPDYIIYDVDNQLRREQTKLLFSGIPIQVGDSDEICKDNKYFEKWKHDNICQRRQRFIKKFNYENDVVKFIKKKTYLSEEQIRNTLEKYTFPDNETLTQFVNYWLQNDSLKAPIWSKIYIIENLNLLNKLRYDLRFENHNITNYDGIFRIESLYSKKERSEIEEDTSLETIIKDYNEQKATYSVTFHDYYAIRNFATTGYRRITGDTHEAKLMKIALYQLAIRQSDDPDEQFDSKLFRVESKPVSTFRITSLKNIKLKKFTPAFPSVESAIRFAGYPAPGFMNILYEMVFHGPYMRAKIEQFYKNKEKNVILLPGSEFIIKNSERVDMKEFGTVLKLTLKFKHTICEKYVWYKNIMNEIGRIQF